MRCDYQSERHCSKTRSSSSALTTCAITSQNDTAPKHELKADYESLGAITSQNDTAPKRIDLSFAVTLGAITSQNDTAPKLSVSRAHGIAVRLPVRTTLLQNGSHKVERRGRCDYQSERHCSKTENVPGALSSRCDYQSERHCSKTAHGLLVRSSLCDYQSERHCSKTIGAKSPLQRTVVSDWFKSLAFKKVQVNNSFSLVLVSLTIRLVLKKQNLRILIKNLLGKRIKVIF